MARVVSLPLRLEQVRSYGTVQLRRGAHLLLPEVLPCWDALEACLGLATQIEDHLGRRTAAGVWEGNCRHVQGAAERKNSRTCIVLVDGAGAAAWRFGFELRSAHLDQ